MKVFACEEDFRPRNKYHCATTMLQHVFRTSGSIFLALAGCAAILYGLTFSTRQLTLQSRTVAHTLHYKEVQALFHKPDANTVRNWAKQYPVLDIIDVPSNAEALAVLKSESGSVAAAVFLREDIAMPEWLKEKGEVVSVPPFTILLTDKSLRNSVTIGPETLHLLEPYSRLQRMHEPDSSWIFFDTKTVTPSKNITEQAILSSALRENRYAGLSEEKKLTIAFASDRPSTEADMTTALRTYLPSPSFVLRATNTSEFLLRAIRSAGLYPSPVNESLFLTFFRSTFGENVSFEHRLTPALKHSVTEVRFNESGALLFAISGEKHAVPTIDAIIDEVHGSIRDLADTSEVTERTFDEKFTNRELQHKEKSIATEKRKDATWNIHVTEGTHTRIVTAVNETNFVISNDMHVLDALKNKSVVSLPVREGMHRTSVLAGGVIDANILSDMRSALLKINEDDDPFFLPQESRFLWSLQANEGMHVFTLQKN